MKPAVGRKSRVLSQIELNRPMKGVSFWFWGVNHAELKLPLLAKVRWPQGRIFWPEAGILVRLRSLGVAIPIQERVRSGRYKAKYRYFTSFYYSENVLDLDIHT
jgi:hypothetical protein